MFKTSQPLWSTIKKASEKIKRYGIKIKRYGIKNKTFAEKKSNKKLNNSTTENI